METKNALSEQVEATYAGTPWYGKSVCQVLKGIEPEVAFRRLNNNVHTIAELLAHMISWKQVLVNQLERNGKPKPRQKETFLTAAYGSTPEAAWQNLKQTLDDQHRRMVQLLNAAGGKSGRFPLKLAQGVVQHDIYHLGQIALLKKAFSK